MSSSSPSPSSSAEIIGNNGDLLTELLTHIPIKPLLQFKLVSKQWNSIISHPSFSLLHCYRHHHLPSSGIFFLHHHHHPHPSLSSIYDFISFTSNPQSNNNHPHPPFFSLLKSTPLDILQSCNGLLLCSSGANICVCNPTTNQLVWVDFDFDFDLGVDDGVAAVNVNGNDDDDCPFIGISLGFDPSNSPHYRIVRVSESSSKENSYSIDVYYSEAKRWRIGVVDSFTVPFDVEFDHGVYWEGRIHWLSHTESTIFFDLEKQCVETLILPKPIEGSYIERFRYFGESCGHLHLIEIRTNCVREFDVLELLNAGDKSEWIVKYRVNLDVLGRGFESEMFQDHSDRFGRGFRFYAFSVLAVVRGMAAVEDDDNDDGSSSDDSALILSIPGKVISYNFRTKVSRLLCNVADESDKLFPFRGHNAVQFIESLYCIA